MTAREGPSSSPHPACGHAGAPRNASGHAVPRRPRCPPSSVRRRPASGSSSAVRCSTALDAHGRAAGRALRARRRRQDHRPPPVGRGRRAALRLGAARRGRLRPRRPAHRTWRWRSSRSPTVDPAVTASLSLAVPPVQRADPAAPRRGSGGGARVRPRPRRRARARGDKAVGGRRHVLRSLPEGAQLAIGSRSDPDAPAGADAGGGRRRRVPRARAVARPRRGRRAHAPARLRGRRGDGRRRPRRHRGLGDRPAAGVSRARRPAAGGVAAARSAAAAARSPSS